jgi:Family of unknown function (DUF6519)
MASDRARISYDPTRAYRGVVVQQGRVTLEADVNEAGLIESEALRLETIDIIGPAGAPAAPPPGDSYKVIPGATPEDTVIHAGVYYLGGWRLTLDQPVTINAQPDWLNRPLPQQQQRSNDLVSLLITEQSVCAVEDQALREVALGGPDSAARLRLMQHFLLLSMSGATCADGAKLIAALLDADGVTLDPYSYELISSATLQVGFVADNQPPDPCSPVAAGGYLGADNQLIRVTVSDFNAQANTGELLWGWNNASILYRATLTDKSAGVFTLIGDPIDQEHAPRLGQAVEILRAEADLKNGDFIAADSGFVTTVTQAYSFDDGTLTVANIAGLPPDFLKDPNPLFMRLWEAIVPFTAGQPAPLDAVSGLNVTVNLKALPAQIAARPFWRFAARPDTPTLIYPRRYLDAAQPPDGPRQWLCDLGVIGPAGKDYELLADCRPAFTPLTEQVDCCCGLTLDPAGVDARGGLQAVVDSLAGGPAVLTLKPGIYVLRSPLVLTGHHRRLTLEGCDFGATIRADPDCLSSFVTGLIIVEKTDAITLRRLDLDIAMVPNDKEGGTVSGIMVAESGLVVIEDCAFTVHAPKDGKISGQVFGGGVTLAGRAAELTVRRNRFVGKSLFENGPVCGLLAAVNDKVVHTSLIGVDISDNYFERLSAAVVAFARLGEVRCASNRVKACGTGIYFADAIVGAAGAFAKKAIDATEKNPNLAQVVEAGFAVNLLAAASQSSPLFSHTAPTPGPAVSAAVRNTLRKTMTRHGEAAYANILAGGQTGTTTEAAAAEPAAAAQISANRPQFLAALAQVNRVAVAVQLDARPVIAVLHIENNDIALLKMGPNTLPGVGIAVLRSPQDDTSMIVMTGNRVICADERSLAAALFFPTMATVTGNMFLHSEPTVVIGGPGGRVFSSIGLETGAYAYAGNVFYTGAYTFPARTTPQPTPDWSFLNTGA